MKFGIQSQDFQILEQKIITPLKQRGASVWIFGSRAVGTQKTFSDVDLLYAIPAGQSLAPGFLFQIKSDLEESRFPYKLDLVDRSELAASYAVNVDAQKILL